MYHHIRKLLDIQDEHITFEDNCVTTKIYNRVTKKDITGRLTYEPTRCLKCGSKKECASIYNDFNSPPTLFDKEPKKKPKNGFF